MTLAENGAFHQLDIVSHKEVVPTARFSPTALPGKREWIYMTN